MANLAIEGIMKDDVTTESHQKFWRGLVFEEHFPQGTDLNGETLTLPLRNPFAYEIKGKLSWINPFSSKLEVSPAEGEIFTLAPGENRSSVFTILGKGEKKKVRPGLLPKLMVRFKAEGQPLDFEMVMDLPLGK
tara:strand:- start:577 stop:978 length:402 start_codon:yes stop_codon:yes gene_type:complete